MKKQNKQFSKVQLELHYSGKNSNNFWDMVNSLQEPHHTGMYNLGIALQNLEDQVLKNLNDIAPGFVAKKYWFNK